MTRKPCMEACAIAMVGNIAMEMERHGLCYARTLERYKEHGMSWVPQVLKRIPARETRKKVLVLVSSVGLSMNRTACPLRRSRTSSPSWKSHWQSSRHRKSFQARCVKEPSDSASSRCIMISFTGWCSLQQPERRKTLQLSPWKWRSRKLLYWKSWRNLTCYRQGLSTCRKPGIGIQQNRRLVLWSRSSSPCSGGLLNIASVTLPNRDSSCYT